MNAKKIVMGILLGIIILAGIAMPMYSRSNDIHIVGAENLPRNLPTITPFPTGVPGVSLQAMQKFTHSETSTTRAHNIEMSVANYRVENNLLLVDLCFELPSNDDWIIYDAFIQSGDVKLILGGSKGIEVSQVLNNGQRRITTFANGATGTPIQEKLVPYDGLPGYRCDTLRFRLVTDLKISHFNLVVKTINFGWTEGKECTTYRDAVQSILDTQNTGVRLDCVKREGGSSFSIAEKPSTMTQEEAEKLISDATSKLTTIEGPWVFSGTIEQ